MQANRRTYRDGEELARKALGAGIAKERLFERALDFCRTPVFIVSSRAELLHANEPGLKLLVSGGCIRLASGCITGSNPSNTARLLREINRVANVLGQPQARSGCVLAGPGEERWALLAFPLLDDAIAPRIGDDAAALLLLSPLDHADVSALKGILIEFFGLTDAEERVALQIAGGKSPAEIAKALHLSIPTVRTHLSHIYHKTETAYRSQLVGLLHSLASFG